MDIGRHVECGVPARSAFVAGDARRDIGNLTVGRRRVNDLNARGSSRTDRRGIDDRDFLDLAQRMAMHASIAESARAAKLSCRRRDWILFLKPASRVDRAGLHDGLRRSLPGAATKNTRTGLSCALDRNLSRVVAWSSDRVRRVRGSLVRPWRCAPSLRERAIRARAALRADAHACW